MQQPNNRIRHARIPRGEPISINSEENHLWAISYADFMMVLLSFFVIFFSLDPGKTEDIVTLISQSQISTTGGTVKHQAVPKFLPPLELDKLKNLAHTQSTEILSDSRVLKILMSDQIFNEGKAVLSSVELEHLKKVLLFLAAFKDKIEIEFIGHTDKAPVQHSAERYLQNNFDLSSLRARYALLQAVELGFSPAQLAIKGSAEHERDSRSLTLQIRERKADTHD